MSENIGVVDWFTKKRNWLKYPKESDEFLDELIIKIVQSFENSSQLSEVANCLFREYQNNELLKKSCSDSRLPICSLFHHLKNTSGIAVCLALQNITKDPAFIKKSLTEYGVNKEYQKNEFIALIRIAALFHDIGKPRFYISSDMRQSFSNSTKQTEELLESILSKTDSELIERFELMKILPLLASRNHDKKTIPSLEKILSLADAVASAADRIYEIKGDFKEGVIEVNSKDRIFPHEINFDAGDFRCLESQSYEILGNRSSVRKNVKLRNKGTSAQLYKDSIVHGGPIKYFETTEYISGIIGIFSLDIRGIQSFINEADELKMLRGGSFIVDYTLDTVKGIISKEVCEEAVLFAGGGNLLAFVPANEAIKEKLECNVEQEIKRISENGMQAAVIYFEEALSTIAENFDIVLQKSQALLEAKKNESHLKAIAPNFGKVCKHCSKRPGNNREICEVCNRKEEAGLKQRAHTGRIFIENTYGMKLPSQVSEIGDSIAVLAFDGNMMGRMFQQTMTPAEYTYKSEIFGVQFEQILKNTISEFLEVEENRQLLIQREKGNDFLGIDILYAGGDDILMIMNAKGALQFAQKLTCNIAENFVFEKQFHDNTTFKNYIVTTSCGIAIADYKFPIYFLLEEAREMESKAKRAFRKNATTNKLGIIELPKGSIAITAISSAMPGNNSICFVLKEEKDKSDTTNLDKLNYIIDFALLDKDRAMISDIITCEDSTLEKLNLIKYMYASLPRKKARVGLDECEWITETLLNPEVLAAAKMLIPHLREKVEEA